MCEIIHSLAQPDATASPASDTREEILDRRPRCEARQLGRQVLLKGLPSLLGPMLQGGMDLVRDIAHQHVRHAYSMQA